LYERNELRKLLAKRDYQRIAETLAQAGQNATETAAALVEDVIHSGMLILQRDTPRDRIERDELQKVVHDFVEGHGSPETQASLSVHLSQSSVLDSCFAEIRHVLSSSLIGKRTAAEQAWGAIDRFVEEVRLLQEQMKKSFLEQKALGPVFFYDSRSARLTGPQGQPVNPDAAVASMARQLALTLLKLAFENDWFDGKQIVLPERINTSGDVRFESGTNSLLAFCWNEVEDASEELRYWGGTIERQRQGVQTPDGDRLEADVVEFKSDLGHHMWEIIARRRFHQAVFKGSTELHAVPGLRERVRDPRNSAVKPLPEQFVSLQESVVHMVLEFIYHLKVNNNTEVYRGLTLAEWIRGYSVLGLYADSGPDGPFVGLVEIDRSDFASTLMRAGFTSERAAQFIEAIIYQRGKRDLYDAPLIRDSKGRLYFIAALFKGVNMADIVTSQLGSLGVSFGKKGKALEAHTRTLFDDLGIKAQGFKYVAEGQTFECDLAVLWHGCLFVFECKNDLLPASRPVLSYFFWNDLAAAAAQVKRIVAHFEADRAIVKQHLAADDWVHVYPIILNAMFFSLPGSVDGVYYYDLSALARFLKEGSVGVIESIPTGTVPVLLKKPIVRLWEGPAPSAKDLVRQLENPVQIAEYQRRMYVEWIRIGISENLVIATRTFRAQPVDLDAILDSHGFSEAEIVQFKSGISSKIEQASKMPPTIPPAEEEE